MDFSLLNARVQDAMSIAPFHEWTFPDGVLWTQFYRTGAGYLLRFPGLADFEVSADALTVACHPAPDATDETPSHLYLNQVLPLVLSKLGKLVFHASAIEVDDAAIAFVAESGRGKSTLAASFATSGYRFLTDDGLVIEQSDDGFQAMPSHPSIRLWKDSQEALVGAGASIAPPLQYSSKARILAGNEFAFCQEPQLLRRVYFLGDGSAPALRFERMSASEALVEWVKHSFLLDWEQRPMLTSHFDRVAKLANYPIYYRLDYPRRFGELARVREAIAAHIKDERRAA